MAYATKEQVVRYLPKAIKETLLADPEHESLINDKLELAKCYINYFVLMRNDIIPDELITPDISEFASLLTALYVVEYYINLAPDLLSLEPSIPNYKVTLINKFKEMRNYIEMKYLNYTNGEFQPSYYQKYIPTDKEELE